MTIRRNPVINLGADWVDVWHDHYRSDELQQRVWLKQQELRHAVVTGIDFAVANQLDFGCRFLFGEAKICELCPLVWLRVNWNHRVFGNPVSRARAESAVTIEDQSVGHLVIRRQCDDTRVAVSLEFNLADLNLHLANGFAKRAL